MSLSDLASLSKVMELPDGSVECVFGISTSIKIMKIKQSSIDNAQIGSKAQLGIL